MESVNQQNGRNSNSIHRRIKRFACGIVIMKCNRPRSSRGAMMTTFENDTQLWTAPVLDGTWNTCPAAPNTVRTCHDQCLTLADAK